jgi:Tol biopolymer transport system component
MTSEGRVHALLLLDPARSDLAQSPDRGAQDDVRHAEWSPDGTRLLTWANDTETTLLVIPVDGSAVVRIGGDARLTWDGAWSPDGRSIAFSRIAAPRSGAGPSAPPDQMPAEIVVAAADGTASPVVAEGILPSWSPDGRRLAAFRPDPSGTDALWVTDVASGAGRRLAAGFPRAGQGVPGDRAIWSPDGRTLVAIGDGSSCGICLVDASTGAIRAIAPEAVQAAVPPGANEADIAGWTADGSVLVAIQGPTSAVIRVDPGDDTVGTVLRLDAVIDEVALTPDRTAFAFTRVEVNTMRPSIWYVGVDGTGLRPLLPPGDTGYDDQPRWQPAPAAVSWPARRAPN